ncbi:acyltransferase [Lutibacter agarilyticus]|uniref:acyltransferase n=1 Tax=Lutibacter agarilyticus TaxID=1109740 RepID=UPI0015954088|nr:acyltransferase [Lutibacter agarilyticus]
MNKLRKQGAIIGKNVQIVDKGSFLYEPWCAELIEIQDEVVIAAGVRLVNHDSSYANIFGKLPTKYGKIIIESNVYIGVNSIILPGVRIGESSLIGAGTIINKSIPPRSVVVGSPCKIIGTIDKGVEKYIKMIDNDNELIDFIDVGGSYSEIMSNHGFKSDQYIMNAYNEYYKKNKE